MLKRFESMPMPLDPEQFAELVMASIRTATGPLVDRIKQLEKREVKDGRDADPELILSLKAEIAALRSDLDTVKAAQNERALESLIAECVKSAVAEIPPAPAGKDADPLVVKAMVDEAVAGLPVPKDGADGLSLSVDDVAPLVAHEVAKAVAALPVAKDGAPGEPGAPGTPVDLADVEALVEKAVAVIPRPQDGKSLTVDDVAPLIASEVAKAVSAVPVPKDGVGVLGALIDRSGHLVLTLSDGTVKALGRVVGRSVDMDDVAKRIADEVSKIPRPLDGKDGADGVGFDDFDVVYDGERTFTCKWEKGARVVERVFSLPVVLDRGVYRPDQMYAKGDGATFAGSFWIAQAETSAKPGDGATPWRLAVKAGREGKPGRDGQDLRERGPVKVGV